MDARLHTDPVPLAQALMRRPSVTPLEAGALDVVEAALSALGFAVRRLKFGQVDNLYARHGDTRPNFCFAGHVDVVPPGDGWRFDPFGAEIHDGMLYGRGGADMKTAIAAMIAASESYLLKHPNPAGSISFLLTCDEEGPAVDGTKAALAALAAEGEILDHCLVGEPTSEDRVGDIIKNGRRGSLNIVITMDGKQGHVAYPHRAINPVTALVETAAALKQRLLDDGAPGFGPSNLEVTSIDVGNAAHNVIPQRAAAKLNIRFNTHHTAESLFEWVQDTADGAAARHGARASLAIVSQSVCFYTPPGDFTALVQAAVQESFGIEPELATTGGTSDARYIRNYCPVVELGLRNATAHMVDEHCAVEDVRTLAYCYEAVLTRYFARSP
ncbi:MAG: succinyl-diaminopimelate desuccinylase [Hyphomonadaceae bacterium]|nr:succinyl-diaminopimelate desuccinylase [Hyphomonadaceae bacterium]